MTGNENVRQEKKETVKDSLAQNLPKYLKNLPDLWLVLF